jgi:hypothetical protein
LLRGSILAVGGLSLVTDHGHNDRALTPAYTAFQHYNKDRLKITGGGLRKGIRVRRRSDWVVRSAFSYSNVAISTNLSSREGLSTNRLRSSGIATTSELLIQNQFHSGEIIVRELIET